MDRKYYTLKINLISTSWVIIFSLLVSTAIASDWVFVAASEDLSFVEFVDKQSIKGNITSRKFWERTVYKKKQIEPVSGEYYIETMEYWEIDCNNSTYIMHEMAYYSNDKKVVAYDRYYPEIIRIVPDSITDKLKEYVCSFKQTK